VVVVNLVSGTLVDIYNSRVDFSGNFKAILGEAVGKDLFYSIVASGGLIRTYRGVFSISVSNLYI